MKLASDLILNFLNEEQSRPIEEQFPLFHDDVQELLKSTRALEKSTERLDSSVLINRSKANERAIQNCIVDWLKLSNDDVFVVNYDHGKLTERNGNTLVKWDTIIIACNVTNKLIFVETKEIPHANGIIFEPPEEKRKPDLKDKIAETNIFFLKTLPNDDGKGSLSFNILSNVYKPLLDYERVYIYASGHIHASEDIHRRLAILKAEGEQAGTYQVCFAECANYGNCHLAQVSSIKY